MLKLMASYYSEGFFFFFLAEPMVLSLQCQIYLQILVYCGKPQITCVEYYKCFVLLRHGTNIFINDILIQVLLCRSFWLLQKFLSDCFPYERFVYDTSFGHTAKPPPLVSGFCVHCNLFNAQVLSFGKSFPFVQRSCFTEFKAFYAWLDHCLLDCPFFSICA